MSKDATTHVADAAVKPTVAASKGPKIIKAKVLGRVEWFNVNEGYGFIKRRDNAENLFFHYTAIMKNPEQEYFCRVEEGQKVQFDIIDGKKGPKAVNISGPRGVPITGKPYEVKNTHNRKMEGEEPKKAVKKQRLPKEPVKAERKITQVSKATMATNGPSQEHVDELDKVKEQRERLKEEMEALKSSMETERDAMRAHFEKTLQAEEANYETKLAAHKAECRQEVDQEEARVREQLKEQQIRFQKESESKMEKSWVYIFGGVCLVAGFLSAQILTK